MLSAAFVVAIVSAGCAHTRVEPQLERTYPRPRAGETDVGSAARFFEAWSDRFRSVNEPDDLSLEVISDDAQIVHIEVDDDEHVTWQKLLGADWKEKLRGSRTWRFFFGDNLTPFANKNKHKNKKAHRSVCSYATLSRAGFVRVDCRDDGERFLLRRLGDGWRIVERTTVTCASALDDDKCPARRDFTGFLCRVVGEGCPPR